MRATPASAIVEDGLLLEEREAEARSAARSSNDLVWSQKGNFVEMSPGVHVLGHSGPAERLASVRAMTIGVASGRVGHAGDDCLTLLGRQLSKGQSISVRHDDAATLEHLVHRYACARAIIHRPHRLLGTRRGLLAQPAAACADPRRARSRLPCGCTPRGPPSRRGWLEERVIDCARRLAPRLPARLACTTSSSCSRASSSRPDDAQRDAATRTSEVNAVPHAATSSSSAAVAQRRRGAMARRCQRRPRGQHFRIARSLGHSGRSIPFRSSFGTGHGSISSVFSSSGARFSWAAFQDADAVEFIGEAGGEIQVFDGAAQKIHVGAGACPQLRGGRVRQLWKPHDAAMAEEKEQGASAVPSFTSRVAPTLGLTLWQ